MDYEAAQHPIGYVARRTGLSTHLIRAWENRYSAVTPGRTDTKRRLYSEADIERLKLLHRLSECGLSIGQIAHRPMAELEGLAYEHAKATTVRAHEDEREKSAPTELTPILGACQAAIRATDGVALEACLLQSRINLPELSVLNDLIGPLMTWVGDRWHDGTLRVNQEHLATDVVKRSLIRMADSYRPSPDAPAIVISTPAGEDHEVGALLVATVAAIEGWKVVYFGPNLPATEVANAVVQTGARLVALSVAPPGDSPRLCTELSDLRQMLPSDIEILVGGGGATRHGDFLRENRMKLLGDLAEFRNLLQARRQTHSSHSTT